MEMVQCHDRHTDCYTTYICSTVGGDDQQQQQQHLLAACHHHIYCIELS